MSDIDIMNKALTYLGNRKIDSTADGTKEADLCAMHYDDVRKIALNEYPWSFATTTVDLVLTTETDDRYAYVYEYPEQCLRVVSVHPANDTEPQDYDSINVFDETNTFVKRITTDVEDARCTMIVDLQDTDAFSPEFTVALAKTLAAEMALPLSKAPGIYQSIAQQAMMAMDYAKKISSYAKKQAPLQSNPYSEARR